MKVLPVTAWLLQHSPEVVRELRRLSNGRVEFGDSERLCIDNITFEVPQGIKVYHAHKERRLGGKVEFLFTTLGASDGDSAYASEIQFNPEKRLNLETHVGALLDYPWYDLESSSVIFHRLCANPVKMMPTWNLDPNCQRSDPATGRVYSYGRHPLKPGMY